MISIIMQYWEGFSLGIRTTMELCGYIWLLGLIFGVLLGVGGFMSPRDVGYVSRMGAFMLSGIPVMVLLFWFHYPMQQLLGITLDPFFTAVVTISLINIFTVGEIVRNALVEFPQQYLWAGKVCGMSTQRILCSIQIPIIFRQILPSLLMTQVQMLHLTLFASLISVEETFRVAQRINASIYQPVEIYTLLALFFLLLCLPLNGFALFLKKNFTRNFSEK